MPRFVVLYHQTPSESSRDSHWDLMLEDGPCLRTWAVAVAPEHADGTSIDSLPDHRLAYLDYEGPISQERGHVTRWDRGTHRVVEETGDLLVVDFTGEKLNGRVRLCREVCDTQRWRFSFDSR